MKPFKEKIHNKLYSMASILLDNVIIPGETKQEGSDSIIASYYDDNGNKFTFTLSEDIMTQCQRNKAKTQRKGRLTCSHCHWFIFYHDNNMKGHCLRYGFTMRRDSMICADFER